MKGEISKSMGVDTKPAHKFEINGYWLMLDPNADEATVKMLRDFIEDCKYSDESEQTCLNCKHIEVLSTDQPCYSCNIIQYYNADLKSKWEAKQ